MMHPGTHGNRDLGSGELTPSACYGIRYWAGTSGLTSVVSVIQGGQRRVRYFVIYVTRHSIRGV